MAGIDKTYVTVDQWHLGKKFWDDTKDQQIRELGHLIGLYHETEKTIYDDCVLWNTSILEDIWLKRNCPLDFIQDRIEFQYGDTFSKGREDGFMSLMAQNCDFSENGIYLHEMVSADEKIAIYFWFESADGETMTLDETDEICLYGTTHFHKVLHSLKVILCGDEVFHGEIKFSYHGAYLIYHDGKCQIETKDGLKDIDFRMSWSDEFKFPKINYSWNSKDAKKYRPEFIFFSTENEIYSLADFKDLPESLNIGEGIRIGRFGLPEYIRERLK